MTLTCEPLTPERWGDLEDLFGANGACGGCWCMVWRLPRKDFVSGCKDSGQQNRERLRGLVGSGGTPGVLGYRDGEAVGWCAIAPRGDYPYLGRSRLFQPLDDTPVWSVSCFFVRRGHRRSGVAGEVLGGAVAWARSQGAGVIEAYPVEPKPGQKIAGAFAFTGLPEVFASQGFREVARPSETRPVMRLGVNA